MRRRIIETASSTIPATTRKPTTNTSTAKRRNRESTGWRRAKNALRSVLYMNTENTSDWGSRSHIRVLALMAATALGIYLCYRMALPFVPALTWALALAVLFMPVHRWLESRLKHRNVAASASVLVISLIVVVPATFVGQRLVSEAVTGAE